MSNITRSELWRRAYILSGDLQTRGQTLPQRAAYVQAAVSSGISLNQEDAEILKLYRTIKSAPTGFANVIDLLKASNRPLTERELRVQAAVTFGLRVDEIFARDDIMGKQEALEYACRLQGLVVEIKEALENWESECSNLQEQIDERSFEYEEAQKDLETRIQRGEVQRDPRTGVLYGFDHLESVGPATQVTDISRPVTAAEATESRCPICLETFTDLEKVVKVACGHICDAECLALWINSTAEKSNTCIMCRTTLFERRPRQPVQWYSDYCDVYEAVKGSERELTLIREDVDELTQLLALIAPREVAINTLGR
ncbi:hypothetical protein BDV96DRAFT_582808 [Lophiotrema nucula]|uniref:RING-type domain-containing protein n=1 Tax=Lophiotrema nucula TaxID=690887 RepID=A0A6A5YYR7_9PLEO|nr:hypothetical protein BDV96DRAFT_582808 [Lophiotrema nucula]